MDTPEKLRFLNASKAVSGIFPVENYDSFNHRELISAIESTQQRPQRHPTFDYIYPVGEADISRCLPLLTSASTPFPLITANQFALEICLDKTRLLDVMVQLDLPVATTLTVSSFPQLKEHADQIEYPVIVKPAASANSLNGEKACICHTVADLDEKFSIWPMGHQDLLLQSYFQGRRHNLYFASESGRILNAVEVRIERTDRLDDTGLAVEGLTQKTTPALLEACEKLVRHLGYHGVGCVQFLVNEATGEFEVLELNPRLGANSVIALQAGLDLPLWALQLGTAEITCHEQIASSPVKLGLRYSWLIGDLQGIRHSFGQKKISASALSKRLLHAITRSCKADVHVTWSKSDPMPTIVLLREFLGSLGAAIARKLAPRRYNPAIPRTTEIA